MYVYKYNYVRVTLKEVERILCPLYAIIIIIINNNPKRKIAFTNE